MYFILSKRKGVRKMVNRNNNIILTASILASIILIFTVIPGFYSPAEAAKHLKLQGKINNPEIVELVVNKNIRIYKAENGEFEATLAIENPGKVLLSIAGLDKKGKEIASKKMRLLNLANFKDVLKDYWAARQIALISTLGIVGGYPDQTFKPTRPITRAEMATILVRSLGKEIPQTKTAIFKDVPLKHWGAQYIAEAQNLGLIKGYPDKTFRPSQNITRAEGVAMVSRFAKIAPEIYNNNFSDLNSAHWAAGIVAGATKAGLLKYLDNQPFYPKRALTRAEAVEIISRTDLASGKIADLLSFETGYDNPINPIQISKLIAKAPDAETSYQIETVQSWLNYRRENKPEKVSQNVMSGEPYSPSPQ
jgi:hypothetical protein